MFWLIYEVSNGDVTKYNEIIKTPEIMVYSFAEAKALIRERNGKES